jgi:hypothetical protein
VNSRSAPPRPPRARPTIELPLDAASSTTVWTVAAALLGLLCVGLFVPNGTPASASSPLRGQEANYQTIAAEGLLTVPQNQVDDLIAKPKGARKIGALPSLPGKHSGVPGASQSRYMKTTDPGELARIGCATGRRVALGQSPKDSIVVLDFGRPMRVGTTYGTSLFGVGFRSTAVVGAAARAYAKAYADCNDSKAPTHLRLAVGTSNYGSDVSYRHGHAWAKMVNDANDWLKANGYDSEIDIAGADDIELSWNTPGPTKSWVRGYNGAAEWPYYDYGDAASCPPRGSCAPGWTQEDVWIVSWGVRSAWPLPEVYTPTRSQAEQWFGLALYSFVHHGSRMQIAGVISQRMACKQSADSCWGMDNDAKTAWSQLSRLLNSDPRTAQQLRWSTDVRWHD